MLFSAELGATEEFWFPLCVSERVLRRPPGRAMGCEGEGPTFISACETVGFCDRMSQEQPWKAPHCFSTW